MKTFQKQIFAFLSITALVLAGCSSEPAEPGQYARVAQCLSEKGVAMYGAFWCPHCSEQKKKFGGDFQYITYQECDDRGKDGNSQLCRSKGVTSYPTWIFPGQGNLVGTQTVEDLAKLANCEEFLPNANSDDNESADSNLNNEENTENLETNLEDEANTRHQEASEEDPTETSEDSSSTSDLENDSATSAENTTDNSEQA